MTVSFRGLFLALLGFTVAIPGPTDLQSSEVGATHLIYEKPVKMKKAEATVLLPYFDQSRKTDTLLRLRTVRCAVSGDGKAGSLPVKGKFRLRLLGHITRTSGSWQSQALTEAVDEEGEADFSAGDILTLATEATIAGADVDLFRIDFDGGRGKKALLLTMDCLHEAFEP